MMKYDKRVGINENSDEKWNEIDNDDNDRRRVN